MKTICLLLVCWCFAIPSPAQWRYAVVIHEIMVDPSPPVSLPSSEWIELKNRSPLPISLRGWHIADDAGRSSAMAEFILQPDSLVIVCSNGSATAMGAYGRVLPVGGFPSLDNEEGTLSLIAADGTVVHALRYSSSWHINELKRQGGWSLEMIDANSPCMGKANWTSSMGASGGSPGSPNTAEMHNPDEAPPRLLQSFSRDAHRIVLQFDEPVDELTAIDAGNYAINGMDVISATIAGPLFDEVELHLSAPLDSTIVYIIKVQGIRDCAGNVMEVAELKVGIASEPQQGQLIINEILFNPRSDGFDYVELYNKGPSIVDASALSIANRNASGAVASLQAISASVRYLYPGDHFVVTADPDNLARQYFVKHPGRVLRVSLPSYPDTEGFVLLLDRHGNILDEVHYKDDWHFKLLNNLEGVALERVDPGKDSNEASTWHSAGAAAGYGTPTDRNSQWLDSRSTGASIEIDPPIFSPDGDGQGDLASIRYKMDEPGYVANVMIFDAAGRCVRKLARNALLGESGYLTWDGLSDAGARLNAGIYVVWMEAFNLAGRRERFKRVLVLGRR